MEAAQMKKQIDPTTAISVRQFTILLSPISILLLLAEIYINKREGNLQLLVGLVLAASATLNIWVLFSGFQESSSGLNWLPHGSSGRESPAFEKNIRENDEWIVDSAFMRNRDWPRLGPQAEDNEHGPRQHSVYERAIVVFLDAVFFLLFLMTFCLNEIIWSNVALKTENGLFQSGHSLKWVVVSTLILMA
jgi:hypothetical protein